MSLESQPLQSDQRLIASAVYNQQNLFIGMVVKVIHDRDNHLTLLIQGDSSQPEAGKILIDGDSIQQIDTEKKRIDVNLADHPPNPVQIEALPLWQEQIKVNRTRRRVGEVSIRKATDIHTIEVPIRSEKLIVENGETGEILTEIALSRTQVIQNNLIDPESTQIYTEDHLVKGHLSQLADAINLLDAIGQFPENGFIKGKIILTLTVNNRPETITQIFESPAMAMQVLGGVSSSIIQCCRDVYLEILVDNRERAATYQNWLSRYHQSGLQSDVRLPKLPARFPC